VRRRSLPLLVATCSAIAGCLHPPPRPDAAARIGGADLVYADFEAHVIEVASRPAAELAQEVLSELLDRWVEENLLRRLAESTQGGPSVETLVAAAATPVGDAEVAAYYRAHEGEYRRPERVDLEQVLLADRASAQEAATRLAAGEDLARVVASLSAPPAEAQGWMQRGVGGRDLPPELARAVFSLAEGETSDVIQADFGFLVFRLGKRTPEGPIAPGEVAVEIRRELETRTLEAARERLVEDGLQRYDVKVFERNLPFTYRGRFASPEP